MRVLNIVLLLLMVLFALVQLNDPDGIVWLIIYAVPAVWAAIAAFSHNLLKTTFVST